MQDLLSTPVNCVGQSAACTREQEMEDVSVFHDIPAAVRDRMRQLEALDAVDRQDGTAHLERLRQIPPETGRFIALLAATAPEGTYAEIGTSAGYSTLWLALACRLRGRRLVTFEHSERKVALARETFRTAGVEDIVDLVPGDARAGLRKLHDVAFCFLDAEKEIYDECYEAVVSRMTTGGILVADNAISHRDVLGPMLDRALADPRADAVVVPVGNGLLVCRKQ